jgi:biotin synthase
LLLEADPEQLESLWREADTVRRESVGNAVHLRGLIEISNHCSRQCLYCGIRAENRHVERCRMTADEILESAKTAQSLGYGTVVLQSGEDAGLATRFIADVVRRIKSETPLAVTLRKRSRSAVTRPK